MSENKLLIVINNVNLFLKLNILNNIFNIIIGVLLFLFY